MDEFFTLRSGIGVSKGSLNCLFRSGIGVSKGPLNCLFVFDFELVLVDENVWIIRSNWGVEDIYRAKYLHVYPKVFSFRSPNLQVLGQLRISIAGVFTFAFLVMKAWSNATASPTREYGSHLKITGEKEKQKEQETEKKGIKYHSIIGLFLVNLGAVALVYFCISWQETPDSFMSITALKDQRWCIIFLRHQRIKDSA